MPRPSAASRELDEIEALSARALAEAPDSGVNILQMETPDAGESSAVGEAPRPVRPRARKFAELPISQRTLAGLAKGKWQRMTDIQRAAIPHALAGRDVLGAAKTGSGKTLAFLVPMLEVLYRERWGRQDGLGAIVISPTRELALQIFDVLRIAGHRHDLSAGLVIGGKDKGEEAERIGHMNVLVCTPGRLLQHLDETAGFDADGLKVLVLDEADRILDLGFRHSLSAILDGLPKQRQTLLFSATQTKDVKALARLSLREPQYIGVHEHSASATPVRLEHHYMFTPAESKLDVLFGFVRSHLQAKVLVFLSSCKQVQFMHAAFAALRPGVPLLCLHGRQKQMKRLAIYTDFCAKKHAVLFATDVAARGLDFPQVQWVVQADCPEDVATYIHRTGRTARYTSSGRALLLLLPSERSMLALLEARKVPLKKLAVNAKAVHQLKPKLQALLSERSELKYTAQRAFVSYVRSVHLHADKTVFDATALPLTPLAESYGLLAPPRVRFLDAATSKPGGKNWAAGDAVAVQRRRKGEREDDEDDDDDDDDDDEDDDEDDEDDGDDDGEEDKEPAADEEDEDEGEEGLVLAPKKKRVQVRDKLKRLLSRNTAERRGEALAKPAKHPLSRAAPKPILGAAAGSAADERGGPLLQVKRTILPTDEDGDDEGGGVGSAAEGAAAAPKKIKIRKGGTVSGGKRTVFDDDGRPLESRYGDFEGIVAEKGAGGVGVLGDAAARVAMVKASLQQSAAADRERERERVRDKHKDRKRKRKAAELETAAEASGGVTATLSHAGGGNASDAENHDDDGKAPLASLAVEAKRSRSERSQLAAAASRADEVRRDELAAEQKLAMLLGQGL